MKILLKSRKKWNISKPIVWDWYNLNTKTTQGQYWECADLLSGYQGGQCVWS